MEDPPISPEPPSDDGPEPGPPGLFRFLTSSQGMRTSVPSLITMKGMGLVLGLASSVIIARSLGPADKGTYNLVLLITGLLATVFDFGVGHGNFYYMAKGEMTRARAYTNLLTLMVVTALLTGPIVLVFAPNVFDEAAGAASRGLLLAAFIVLAPLTLHSFMSQSLLLGIDRAIATYLLPLVIQAVTVCGAVVVVVWLDLGLSGMLAVTIVSYTAGQLVAFAILRHGSRGLLAKPSLSSLMRSARFGFPLWISVLLSMLLQRVDQLMIAGKLGVADLGQYALAVSLGEMLWTIDVTITTAMRYQVASSTAESAAHLVERVTRLVIITMATLCLGLAAIAGWLIPTVYSEAFRPAVGALLAYLPAVFFLSVARVIGEDIGYQHGRTGVVLLNNAVALGANILSLLLLLPAFGIVGAALASVVAYAVLATLNTVFHCRLAGSRARDALIPRAEDLRTLRGLAADYARAFLRRR